MRKNVFSLILLIIILSVIPVGATRITPPNRAKLFGFFNNSTHSQTGTVAGIKDSDSANVAVPTPPAAAQVPSATVTPTPSAVAVPAPSASIASSEPATEIMNLISNERIKAGLPALIPNPKVSDVALRKTRDMIDNKYFEHSLDPYETSFDMLLASGINYRTAGENLAYGYIKPETVVKTWMESPSHRANILCTDYNQMGVAVLKNARGINYWTVVFVKLD